MEKVNVICISKHHKINGFTKNKLLQCVKPDPFSQVWVWLARLALILIPIIDNRY